jgi:hypothetical protein
VVEEVEALTWEAVEAEVEYLLGKCLYSQEVIL